MNRKLDSEGTKKVGQRALVFLRLLGFLQCLTAIVLLPMAGFFGVITIPIIMPFVIWMILLGIRLWRADRTVLKVLKITHVVLLFLAMLLGLYGWFCLQSAQRSAEAGGGLLGSFGLIPIVMGVFAGSVSVISLLIIKEDLFPMCVKSLED